MESCACGNGKEQQRGGDVWCVLLGQIVVLERSSVEAQGPEVFYTLPHVFKFSQNTDIEKNHASFFYIHSMPEV